MMNFQKIGYAESMGVHLVAPAWIHDRRFRRRLWAKPLRILPFRNRSDRVALEDLQRFTFGWTTSRAFWVAGVRTRPPVLWPTHRGPSTDPSHPEVSHSRVNRCKLLVTVFLDYLRGDRGHATAAGATGWTQPVCRCLGFWLTG